MLNLNKEILENSFWTLIEKDFLFKIDTTKKMIEIYKIL